MSFRVGIILPQNLNKEIKEKLYNKYNIKLNEFENKCLFSYLREEEATYQISEDGDDSKSGIGSYEIYNKTLEDVYNSSLSDTEKEFFIKDFKERKENLEKDAKKWVEIIQELIRKS